MPARRRTSRREDDKRMDAFEARLNENTKAFNRHLEIYAANGHEMQRLGDLIEHEVVPRLGRVDEMYGILTGAKTLRSAVKWAFIILVSTGSGVSAWRIITTYFHNS